MHGIESPDPRTVGDPAFAASLALVSIDLEHLPVTALLRRIADALVAELTDVTAARVIIRSPGSEVATAGAPRPSPAEPGRDTAVHRLVLTLGEDEKGELLLLTPSGAPALPAASAKALTALISALIVNHRAITRQTEAVQQLTEAHRHRGTIEQAKGILMARTGCSAQQAFAHLRTLSQRNQRKLHDVARDVVTWFSG